MKEIKRRKKKESREWSEINSQKDPNPNISFLVSSPPFILLACPFV